MDDLNLAIFLGYIRECDTGHGYSLMLSARNGFCVQVADNRDFLRVKSPTIGPEQIVKPQLLCADLAVQDFQLAWATADPSGCVP